jgi:hypothetical protein
MKQQLTPTARLAVIVFVACFVLMLWAGDHNLYLVDERTGQVKLKHVATFGEKLLPSALLAGVGAAIALGLNWLLNRNSK